MDIRRKMGSGDRKRGMMELKEEEEREGGKHATREVGAEGNR